MLIQWDYNGDYNGDLMLIQWDYNADLMLIIMGL